MEIKFNEVNKSVAKIRAQRWGNEYYSVDDLPLTYQQKLCVVEYLARWLWRLLLDTEIMDSHCKSYDPLMIVDGKAHSYVFDMEDGGRHHLFNDLKHLEEMMYKETLDLIKQEIRG